MNIYFYFCHSSENGTYELGSYWFVWWRSFLDLMGPHIILFEHMSCSLNSIYFVEAMTSSRTCVNDANAFCYTCGQFTIKGNPIEIDNFYKTIFAYFACLKVKPDDQDKPWPPHYVCNTCKEHIRQWTNGKRKSLSFCITMIWWARSNHHDDCYFCVVPNVHGFNKKNRKSI